MKQVQDQPREDKGLFGAAKESGDYRLILMPLEDASQSPPAPSGILHNDHREGRPEAREESRGNRPPGHELRPRVRFRSDLWGWALSHGG